MICLGQRMLSGDVLTASGRAGDRWRVIELPGEVDLGWNFGFDKGQAYACMSETIMLALDRNYTNTGIGADLNIAYMNELRECAERHGFRLAGFRSFDLPLPESVWGASCVLAKS